MGRVQGHYVVSNIFQCNISTLDVSKVITLFQTFSNAVAGFARKRDDGDAMQCQQWELGETTMVEGAAQCDDCDAGTCGQTKRGCSASSLVP